MFWLRKTRPLLVAAGGVALVGSLLGARLLGAGGGGTDATGKTPAPPAPKDAVGTVVLGTADSDPPPARYGLPPIPIQSGQVAEVFVKQGDEVKAGAKLYRFDSTIFETKLDQAKSALAAARAKADTARGAAAQHATKVDLQKQVVAANEAQVKLARDAWQLGELNLVDVLRNQGVPPEKIDERRKTDVKLFELSADYEAKKVKTAIERATLADVAAAKVNQVDKLIAEADADATRYEAVVREAENTVRLCTVTAKMDGAVERVSVSPGDVMGISSVAPALVLIPAGPRVVRARVEAEFASKIGPNQIGRAVVVQDASDPRVQWPGRVRGPLGGSFLPRRANEGALVQSETRSLEVVIEVADAAPPGKPPLRVGQEVRVTFAP